MLTGDFLLGCWTFLELSAIQIAEKIASAFFYRDKPGCLKLFRTLDCSPLKKKVQPFFRTVKNFQKKPA